MLSTLAGLQMLRDSRNDTKAPTVDQPESAWVNTSFDMKNHVHDSPFKNVDEEFEIANLMKEQIIRKIGTFYATVVAQRLSEASRAPPAEMKRMNKNEIKKMKTKYSAFFDPPHVKSDTKKK